MVNRIGSCAVFFDQRRHCKQDSQQPFNKVSLRKRIVMSIFSPDSLVVAVKLGHMLVICRSKSSLCLDLLNEIEYTYTWTNALDMLPEMDGAVETLRYVLASVMTCFNIFQQYVG